MLWVLSQKPREDNLRNVKYFWTFNKMTVLATMSASPWSQQCWLSDGREQITVYWIEKKSGALFCWGGGAEGRELRFLSRGNLVICFRWDRTNLARWESELKERLKGRKERMRSKAQLENQAQTEWWASHPRKQKEREEQMVQRR